MNNTRDLSQFGHRERQIAAELLLAIGSDKDQSKFIGENVSVEFNPNSGNVFLVDHDCNVAMLNDGKLEDFVTCHECGAEGCASDFKSECTDECCQELANELELVG